MMGMNFIMFSPSYGGSFGIRHCIVMIYVICGAIGAGKSTYARENFKQVTEREDTSKHRQIMETIELSRHGDVAHVTTLPTPEEIKYLRGATFIWMDTPPEQCMENVRRRGRPRDLANLPRVEEANRRILRGYRMSKLPFVRKEYHAPPVE